MRLGAYPAALRAGSKVSEVYGNALEISERHRHRYEVNVDYKDRLEACGLEFSGMSPDGVLPETVEYPDHPWFIGVQYHPELKSPARSTRTRCSPVLHQAAAANKAGWFNRGGRSSHGPLIDIDAF
jgi:CTP synthase (UTP-ammonia lyase)